MVYQAHFKQVLTWIQIDPSCLTIDFVHIRRHFVIPSRLSTIRPRYSSI
jgi:hypothetical protein